MKIQVLHIISDRRRGGAGSYLLNFLRAFDRSALEVSVLCPPESELLPAAAELGVAAVACPGLQPDRSFHLRGLGRLYRELRRRRRQGLQLVHTHGSFSGRLAARLAGVPAILYTRHRLDAPWPAHGWRSAGWRWLDRITADRVIAVSRAVAAQLAAQGMAPERVCLIYNGVDLPGLRRRAAAAQPAAAPAAGPRLGVVARLEPEKGQDVLLRAAVELSREFPGLRIDLVGGGSQEAAWRELAAQLGLSGRVRLVGPQPDPVPWLLGFDVVVVPSREEAFGLSLVEAMALGRPCVASGVGGIREIAGAGEEAGAAEKAGAGAKMRAEAAVRLVPPDDPPALAAALAELLRRPEAAQALGERGRLAAERFSAKRMAGEMTALYQQLVKERIGSNRS